MHLRPGIIPEPPIPLEVQHLFYIWENTYNLAFYGSPIFLSPSLPTVLCSIPHTASSPFVFPSSSSSSSLPEDDSKCEHSLDTARFSGGQQKLQIISAVLPLGEHTIRSLFYFSYEFQGMLNLHCLQDVYPSILIEIYHYQLPTQTKFCCCCCIHNSWKRQPAEISYTTQTEFATQIVSPYLHHKMSRGMGTMLIS